MARPLTRPLSCLMLLAAAACAVESPPVQPPVLGIEDGGAVVATVRVEAAAPGAAVSVDFQNTVEREFGFNPCERNVQRETADGWETLPDELRLCTAEVYLLAPSASRTELVDVPLGLAPGRYRFVFTMRSPATPDVVRPASTAFEVR